MAELASSMSAGSSEDKTPLGIGKPQIIWPTVEDVRCSLEVRIRILRMELFLFYSYFYFLLSSFGNMHILFRRQD